MLRTKAWFDRRLALFYRRNSRRGGGENPCLVWNVPTWGTLARRRARAAMGPGSGPSGILATFVAVVGKSASSVEARMPNLVIWRSGFVQPRNPLTFAVSNRASVRSWVWFAQPVIRKRIKGALGQEQGLKNQHSRVRLPSHPLRWHNGVPSLPTGLASSLVAVFLDVENYSEQNRLSPHPPHSQRREWGVFSFLW